MSGPTIDAEFVSRFGDGGEMQREFVAPQSLVPMSGVGAATDRAVAAVITAQRVAVKRNRASLVAEAMALATAAGDDFYYSIPFRDRKSGTTTYVEGPSIGCAMAAVNCYGNCTIEAFPSQETATHWTFLARFVDLEKGVTVTRSFQQRKGQDTGMRDGGRAADMVFQIGQSKAMRNAVVAGLKWLTDEMMAAAKSGILLRINKNPEGARKAVVNSLVELQIDQIRVERIIGRPADKWLTTDLAKLYTQIGSIREGFVDAADLFPEPGQDAEDLREANQAAEPEQPKATPPAARKAKQPAPPSPPPPPPPPPQPENKPAAAPDEPGGDDGSPDDGRWGGDADGGLVFQ